MNIAVLRWIDMIWMDFEWVRRYGLLEMLITVEMIASCDLLCSKSARYLSAYIRSLTLPIYVTRTLTRTECDVANGKSDNR